MKMNSVHFKLFSRIIFISLSSFLVHAVSEIRFVLGLELAPGPLHVVQLDVFEHGVEIVRVLFY